MIRILEKSPLFHGLTEEETGRAVLLMEGSRKSYGKGELVHLPGTPMRKFGLLLKGTVQACIDDLDGNRMIMTEVVPGASFGDSLCFLKICDSAVYIYAPEEAEVLWLTPDALFRGGEDPFHRELERRFTAMLARRTLSMNQRIQILSKLTLRDKLCTFFTERSRDAGSLSFSIPFNREDMAAYMGTNRSALSRELGKMKKEGLIDFSGNRFTLLKKGQ